MDHLIFPLLGLGNGAVFAALALALVVTYRSSGVVNIASGAIALFTAYTYAFLRRGEFLLPVPGVQQSISLPFTPGLGLALGMALVIAAVFGSLLYLAVFRPLRSAPAVAKAVASIGIMVTLQAALAAKVGTSPVNTPRIFPAGVVTLHGINVNAQILWLAATIVAVTVAIWLAFRLTRFGLATRAVAETEKGALVTGLSPDRIALANWAISAAVAGLGGILIAPIAPIIPGSYTLYVVPALAAALVGGFTSLPVAVAAAFAIGAANSELAHLQAEHAVTWLSVSATASLVPLGLILAYLVLRGRPLPTRGALVLQTLGRAPRPRVLAAPTIAGVAVAVVALVTTSGNTRAAVTTSMILAVVALSLVVVTGYAGQISLAQVTLAGVGAFALNRLTMNMGVPFPIAPLLAATAAMVIGVIVGLPALRIRGLPVAVVTLALAVALHAFWFTNPELTNANDTTVEDPRLLGVNLAVGIGRDQNRLAFGLLCLAVLTATALAVAWLRRSRLGAAMLAVRANERAAAAAGIDVARTKVVAFAIGAFTAGLGGALLAYQQTRANESQFNPLFGLGLFASAYLAGITSIHGALLAGVIGTGGIAFTLLTDHVRIGTWYEAAMGALLVVNLIKNPEGLAAGFHSLADRVHRRRAPRTPPRASGVLTGATSRRAVETSDTALLDIEGITVRFGGVVAVDGVSLTVPEGAIVGLIGPNGAGKTTLIDAISGFSPAQGEVRFAGNRIDSCKPHQRVRRGVGRTFQGIELYEDLSVIENIRVGEEAARHGGYHVEPIGDHIGHASERLCELLGIAHLTDKPARELSQGQRQLVSVARALSGEPRLVLLDEPAGGLDSSESQWLGERLRRIRDLGVTILMIDHDMHLVLEVCDLIHVLDLGRIIASGTPAEIRTNPAVAEAYLGSAHAGARIG